MKRLLIVLGCGLLLLVNGLVHGLWSERWGNPHEALIEQASARMSTLPLTLGDWDGRPIEIDQSSYPEELHGNVVLRRYVHRYQGSVVTLVLSCGPTHSLWNDHSPLECYPRNGFEVAVPAARQEVAVAGSSPAAFWVATFSRPGLALAPPVRVLWAWSGAGQWQAPDRPGWAFAHYPYLYKLYIINDVNSEEGPLEAGPAQELVRLLLPELNKCLFPGEKPS
jgi:hypothetical protein